MMSGPYSGDPVPLSAELIRYYRELLFAHADDPTLGACPSCLATRCWDWRFARTQLICAGEPVATTPTEGP